MMEKNIETATLDFFRLKGQSAIVTGAGNGIGRAAAIMLANLGASVTACDIEADSVAKVVEEIRAQGGTATAVTCDVCQLDDIKKTVAAALEAYGKIDILVNNAAGCGGGKTIDDMTYPEWDRLIKLNLSSVYMFATEVIPHMIRNNRGKICNISSGAGIVGDFSDPHYAAAKAGVLGLTKELAWELAKYRINVNSVAPGLTDTRMARIRPWEDEIKDTMWYRAGIPEDQAYAICFLVSEAAEFITGQTVSPNGGAWM